MECNTFNQTFSSLTVSCSVRDLRPQSRLSKLSYQFEVKNAHSLELVRNVTTDTPALTVSGLPAASDFLISVYSSSGGVRSPAVSLEGFTTRPGEKQLATMPELEEEQPLRCDRGDERERERVDESVSFQYNSPGCWTSVGIFAPGLHSNCYRGGRQTENLQGQQLSILPARAHKQPES